ncbi:hypothetical protein [Haladaptatus sp. DJG-WS-42]|uniref:hypothetical protein n=1 Tax=Haladaptatus sp. DJG-WS-42 TaxID=3120516 RepID=UPI0030D2136E
MSEQEATKSTTDDESRESDSPRNSQPIISSFTIEEDVVKRYEDSMDWVVKTREVPMMLFGGVYFITMMLVFVFIILLNTSATLVENVAGGLVVIGVIGAFIAWLIKYVSKKSAKKQNVTRDEAVYHRFARAMDEYVNRNTKSSMQEFQSGVKMFDYKDEKPFSPAFSTELEEYNERIQEDDGEEFYNRTFSQVLNRLTDNMSDIENASLEYLYVEATSLERSDGYTLREILKSYFFDSIGSRAVRIVLPYVFVAPVIYAIYTFDERIASITAIVLVAIIQTYNNPEE